MRGGEENRDERNEERMIGNEGRGMGMIGWDGMGGEGSGDEGRG